MSQPLKTAIIGVGSMGKHHARIASQLPNINLVALVDANLQIAQTVADGLFTDRPRPRLYQNLHSMLSEEKPDCVAVCVPTSLHREVGMACLQAGCHLLLEKPIADNLQSARELQKSAQAAHRVLMIGHIERYNPAVQKVQSLIEEGAIGNIVSIQAKRVSPMPARIQDVNIAVDLAIHDIDIVQWLINEPLRSLKVQKRAVHLLHREDSVDFFLGFENASAYIQSNWITPTRMRTLSITGSEGYLHLDYLSYAITHLPARYDKTAGEAHNRQQDAILHYHASPTINIAVEPRESLLIEWQNFIETIVEGKPHSCEHAISALAIALSN